jgi:CheY-like chemotaxis protein
MHATTQHVILYADDDHDDQTLIKQAFKKYDNNITIKSAFNGEEAWNFLDNLASFEQHPCLIILDINMPRMDGKETLMKIRQSDKHKNLPVVMFSTSNSSKDKEFAEKWGAVFISKPVTFTDLANIAEDFVKHCDFEMSRKGSLEKAS